MKIVAPLLSRLALSLAAAFGAAACDKTISLSDFDTSCKTDSDCIPAYVGAAVCCPSPNAAINVSDQAKYEAELDALEEGGSCHVGCFAGQPEIAFCHAGTCAIEPEQSGASDAGTLDGG